jgi:hypothetical protein
VFSDKLTDGDLDTIQQRVARQQRQFAEYENREKLRKFEKVYAIYDYLTIEEMEESLQDCNGNEVTRKEGVFDTLTNMSFVVG